MLLLAWTAVGCIKVDRPVTPPPVARKATLDELTPLIDRFTQVQSLEAKVTLQLKYLNDERTEESSLLEVDGFIVAERPESIRVRAQVPVTRTTAFDMVSTDGSFKVYLTFKDRFFEGSTAVETRSEKRSENIRPQHVFEPLLVKPAGEDGILTLDVATEGPMPYYVIQELVQEGDRYRITRKFWFSRLDLELDRLEIRGKDGEVATTARYSGWTDWGEARFPEYAVIERPIDGYTLTVRFLEPGIDEPPTEQAFVLEPPEGLEVERIEAVADAVAEETNEKRGRE